MPPVTFDNPRGRRLVADYTPAVGGTAHGDVPLIILAHGFGSERLARGRFPAMARAFAGAGHAALAFDFAGCGESDDDILTLEHQLEDLCTAIAYGQSLGHERIGLVGHSLGGRVCLQAAPPEATTIVAIGAPTGPVDYDWHDYFSAEQMDELECTGRVTIPQAADRSRPMVVSSRELLEELRGCDQVALFGGVPYPVLLVFGDGDWEERQYLELGRRGLPLLPAGSRLELVPGSPHNLQGHLDEVIALVLDWFTERLPA